MNDDNGTTLRITSKVNGEGPHHFGLEVTCSGCGQKLKAVQKVVLTASNDDFPEAVVTIGGVQVDADLHLHAAHLGGKETPCPSSK